MINQLSCLKCGTRSALTSINYSKEYRSTYISKDGNTTKYLHKPGRRNFAIPICTECLMKINKWRNLYYISTGIFIILGLISVISSAIQPSLGFFILIPLTLLNCFIFIIAHGSNPRTFSKFTFYSIKDIDKVTREYIHYVRPLTSNKWVKFDIWADVIRSSSSTYQLKLINPLTWKLPLIGAIIISISLLSPAYISLGTDINVSWFLSFYYSNSFTYIYLNLSTFYLNLLFYFIILVGIFITIKQTYILKRANTSLNGSERIILITGILILLIAILQVSTTVQIIGPALYGLMIGSILMIFGSINQYYRNKQ